jgi:hypothetical protein
MSPVASDDAEDGAGGTMTRITGNANGTFTTACVDLADHSLSDLGSIGRAFNHSDEFMTNGSLKSSVALYDLKIGITDAGKSDANNCFVFGNRSGFLGQAEGSI